MKKPKKKKKQCKADQGTEQLRKGQEDFRDFLHKLRQSAIEEQNKKNWLDYDSFSK